MNISNIHLYSNIFQNEDVDNKRSRENLILDAGTGNRNTGPDTVSFSAEALQMAKSQDSSGSTGSEFLEKYQVPSWLVDASSPHCVYNGTLLGKGHSPKPIAANDYDTIVSDTFHNALQDNGITSDNYYEDFLKNPVMNEQVKKDMYAYLQQNSKAMELMQTWNPALFQQLS